MSYIPATPRAAPALRPVVQKIIYEQPLNERMRTFLRLEYLFHQAAYAMQGQSVWDCRAALATLVELLSIVGRSDLRNEAIKELDRHQGSLLRLTELPGVDQPRLRGVLERLAQLSARLQAMPNQFGVHLKSNELINSIVQRSGIPGGLCEFDLPTYHHWLRQPYETRMYLLGEWWEGFEPLRQTVEMVLKLTRQSSLPTREIAAEGSFQKSLTGSVPCQLVRVALPSESPWFAEISGSKHRCTVRFLSQPDLESRPVVATQDVEFDLACCVI